MDSIQVPANELTRSLRKIEQFAEWLDDKKPNLGDFLRWANPF